MTCLGCKEYTKVCSVVNYLADAVRRESDLMNLWKLNEMFNFNLYYVPVELLDFRDELFFSIFPYATVMVNKK